LPQIRAFRALRFDPQVVGDIASVVCPPYDVIGPEQHQALLERSPYNAVRLDLPEVQAGEEPDDRYRRAAHMLADWRANGTMVKDGSPSIYVYEQTYRVPGTGRRRTQRGFLARLLLEPFGPTSGVMPHERTLSAPKEDRYKVLRATGVNTSPVIGIYTDSSHRSARTLTSLTVNAPDCEAVDDDGVRHRLWAVPEGGPEAEAVSTLLDAARKNRITIADGHHRYETALRYRDERRGNRTWESDPPSDYVLMLFLETSGQKLTVLPTHRIVLDLGEDGVAALLDHAEWLFEVQPVAGRADLEAAYANPDAAPGGEGRFGLWTRKGGALLRARCDKFPVNAGGGGAALRRLDVTLLQAALDRLCGIDAASIAAGRLAYSKSVAEALDTVDDHRRGADAAFLLDPTPVADIEAVAMEGDVMPQKSTYFYPKALTGLLINPHEW
jgi:uncharacterized protein (DUF1015 family)